MVILTDAAIFLPAGAFLHWFYARKKGATSERRTAVSYSRVH